MIEKTKLGIWDYFVYLMTGMMLLLIIAVHCALEGIVTIKQIMTIPSAALVTLLLLALLLLGMLIEPIANLLFKLLTTYPNKWSYELGFEKWKSSIENQEQEAQKFIPELIQSSSFSFSKNWVLIHGNSSEFQAFLSKYGFYRSISFVFAANAIAFLVMHWGWVGTGGFVASTLLCLLYAYRASVFYHHISISVYNQFIQGHS